MELAAPVGADRLTHAGITPAVEASAYSVGEARAGMARTKARQARGEILLSGTDVATTILRLSPKAKHLRGGHNQGEHPLLENGTRESVMHTAPGQDGRQRVA
jgi:hypothetical protein